LVNEKVIKDITENPKEDIVSITYIMDVTYLNKLQKDVLDRKVEAAKHKIGDIPQQIIRPIDLEQEEK
jgi:hypothetical protein